MKVYNQAFKNALQFVSKHLYLTKSARKLQNDITALCHWLDDNPNISEEKLLDHLAKTLRKHIQRERY